MPERHSEIPPGFLGSVRRAVAGGRIQIDHCHAEMEFDLILRGSGRYLVGDQMLELRPGTLVWLVPDVQHRLVRAPNLEMWVVSLAAQLAPAEWTAQVEAQPTYVLDGDQLIDLDRLLGQIAQDFDDPQAFNAGLAYAIARAVRACRASQTAILRSVHPAVARALLVIRERPAGISLSDVAREVGVAASYLSRLLITDTNRSFVEWRNRARLEHFFRTYRAGSNLLTACLDAGFGSYERFHVVFKDMVGCSPSAWAAKGEGVRANVEALTSDGAWEFGPPAADNLLAQRTWARLIVPELAPVGTSLSGRFLSLLLEASGTVEMPSPDLPCFKCSCLIEEMAQFGAQLEARNLALARDFRTMLGAPHDVYGVCADILEAFGLCAEDLADVVAAILALSWTIVHKAGDPGQGPVQALARQARQALFQASFRVGTADDVPGARTLHVALICHFFVFYRAMEAARATSDVRMLEQLSGAVRGWCVAVFGNDLARTALGASGLTET